MSVKTKITLIIGGIISFFFGWVILVISLIDEGNIKNNQSNIIKQEPIKQQVTKDNKEKNNNTHKEKNVKSTTNNEKNINKIKHTLKIRTYKNLVKSKAWKIFSNKYKNLTDGKIEIINENSLKEYNKNLIYSLATKDSSFDLAIIPAYWYKDIEDLNKSAFKLSNSQIQLSSIFDYNFENFVKNNYIKAIPFAIEPIVGFSFNNNIKSEQTFETWKEIIIKDKNRLDDKGKIKTMPVLLGYDKIYLNILKKGKKTLFPILDIITNYYIFKKSKEGLSSIKEFGTSNTYKSFDLKLYYKLSKKFKKISFCKEYYKYCLLANNKSKLVYGFSSDIEFFNKNRKNIFKKFKKNTKKLKLTTLPLANKFSEYPTRNWIIIVNPNSKKIKFISLFLKSYINLGQNGRLPLYKNIISPFVQNKIKNEKLKVFKKYKGKFISLEKIGIKENKILNKKIINYFLGNISIDLVLKK